jgi:ferrous iron transport protein B
VFNHLTGSSQIIGNWPGKTVESAQGMLNFEGRKVVVVDLPGIYSFSTFSMEEIVSREYIAFEHPDVVINVVDASVLERNLFFTIQLLEMEAPLVVCLNQADVAKKKGISIDRKKLEQMLGVPVVSTVAIRGEGIYELAKTAVKVAENKGKSSRLCLKYGAEIEERIERLAGAIKSESLALEYPSRWVAIKLLENDPEIKKSISSKSEKIVRESEVLAGEISQIHGEQCFAVIASERYSLASRIVAEVQEQSTVKTTVSERLDWVTTHRVFGYVTSAGVMAGLLLWTFAVGGFLSS